MSGGDGDAANKKATPQAMILRPAKRRKKPTETPESLPEVDTQDENTHSPEGMAKPEPPETSHDAPEVEPAQDLEDAEEFLDSFNEESAVSVAFAEAMSNPTAALPELESEAAESPIAEEVEAPLTLGRGKRDGTETLSGKMRPFAAEPDAPAKLDSIGHPATMADVEDFNIDEESFSEVRDETLFLLDSRDRNRAFAAADDVAAMGTSALEALCEMFPGRLFIDRHQFSANKIPPASEHGPVLKTLSLFKEEALDSLIPFLKCQDLELRFYAVLLIHQMEPKACPTEFYDCLFDRDSQIRAITLDSLVAIKKRGHDLSNFRQLMVSEIDVERDEFRIEIAARYCSALLLWDALPYLIDILGSYSQRTNQTVLNALQRIGLVELNSPYDWKNWWAESNTAGREESLIQGTTSNSEQVRF
jgi:hypothetical protein